MDTPQPFVTSRIVEAIGAHDLDRLVACFAVDVHSETPAHPGRDFVGRDQVRRNWTQIFGAVPDIEADVIRATSDGSTEWTELEFHGHRRDGSPHRMRGVTVNTVAAGLVTAVRFYLEPVDDAALDADAAVARIVGAAIDPAAEGPKGARP
jgi:ketosteroid isomerase-like protein